MIIITMTAFIIFIILKMSLVVFDYDDTLFPTTFMQHHQDLKKRDLQELDRMIVQLMHTIKLAGHKIIIISNGSLSWIRDSSSTFLPNFYKFVQSNNIRMISARDIYEPTGISYENWKRFTMISTCVLPEYVNMQGLIGIGDSPIDQLAVRDAGVVIGKPFQFIKFEPEMSLEALTQTIAQAVGFFRGF